MDAHAYAWKHYILHGFCLFFECRPRKLPNGTQTIFATYSEGSQILKWSSKMREFPPPKTWRQKLPMFEWIYDDVAT